MRVLAITPYYTPEGGGLERYSHELLTRLAARGHDVEALAFTRTGVPDSECNEGGVNEGSVNVGGVKVQRLRPSFFLGNSPIHAGFASHVARRIRDTRPDVVVAHTPVPFPAEMAFRAARREKVPFVATYHAGTMRGSSPMLGTLAAVHRATFERSMIAGADHLIAVSPYVRDHALARARDRVTLVPPGVDSKRFHSPAPPDGPGILLVSPLARSYRWKGVDVLWRAFARVRQRMPEATLTLIGGGDRLDEFRQRAQDPAARVRVLGRIAEETLLHEYRRAAVVTLPSTTDAESFGMVLAEANACGRPVVGSAIGGIQDFVRHGDNGFLARPGDHNDLADKLVDVLSEQSRAQGMGLRGRERVVREHNWDELAVRTEAVFERVVAA